MIDSIITIHNNAQHILDQKHEYGSIDDTMDILKISQKGNNMNILVRFYIYKTVKYKPIINEQFVMDSKVSFDLVIDIQAEVIAGTLAPLTANSMVKYPRYVHISTSAATPDEHTIT
jgi:hypothetical protein